MKTNEEVIKEIEKRIKQVKGKNWVLLENHYSQKGELKALNFALNLMQSISINTLNK